MYVCIYACMYVRIPNSPLGIDQKSISCTRPMIEEEEEFATAVEATSSSRENKWAVKHLHPTTAL